MARVLEAESLSVRLGGAAPVEVLRGLDFTLDAGRTLGVVGESGCGKSMTALAIMGLLPPGAGMRGTLRFQGQDLLALPAPRRRALRGRRMAMIFQEPMTALNPVMRAGEQIAELLVVHEGLAPAAALDRAVELMARVGIAAPDLRARAWPHELSGGMRQRVMIAMAIACRPALLIADEPTTALDVSVQAQILDLLLELQRQDGTALVFISHNFAVVEEMADDILVMYAGRAVEAGPAATVLAQPAHPYTRALLATMPDIDAPRAVLPVIAGQVPALAALPPGCSFAPRCGLAEAACTAALPPARDLAGRRVACIRA